MNARTASPDRRVGDRRVNHLFRKSVLNMSPDELRRALLTDELTGLGNRRAWREAARLPVQVFVDVDNLKYVNDAYGHDAGDALLIAVGNAIEAACEGGRARGYRFSGDEFVLEFASVELAETGMEALTDALRQRHRIHPSALGRLPAIGISYGIAPTLAQAESLMREHKAVRTLTGERVARGAAPLQGGAQ